jgi:hypothetical protein
LFQVTPSLSRNHLTLSEGIAETVKWFRDNEGVTWNKPVTGK